MKYSRTKTLALALVIITFYESIHLDYHFWGIAKLVLGIVLLTWCVREDEWEERNKNAEGP